jgi:hypothetical protein
MDLFYSSMVEQLVKNPMILPGTYLHLESLHFFARMCCLRLSTARLRWSYLWDFTKSSSQATIQIWLVLSWHEIDLF